MYLGYAKPIYGNVRISVVTLSRNLINWAQASHEVQLKILTNGILFAEIKAIENLLPYLNEQVCLMPGMLFLYLCILCIRITHLLFANTALINCT